jgi:hypothetical protein
MEPGFGICAPRALEIRSRFSFRSTKMRFREQLRWGHHDEGSKVDRSPAKAQPVYYRNMIEDPLSLALLGEGALLEAPPRSIGNILGGAPAEATSHFGASTCSVFSRRRHLQKCTLRIVALESATGACPEVAARVPRKCCQRCQEAHAEVLVLAGARFRGTARCASLCKGFRKLPCRVLPFRRCGRARMASHPTMCILMARSRDALYKCQPQTPQAGFATCIHIKNQPLRPTVLRTSPNSRRNP